MEKFLIINITDVQKLYLAPKFIQSLQRGGPCQIDLLLNERNRADASILKGITNFHFIDLKKIDTYLSNKLYSKAFALEDLHDSLQVLTQNWDHVINLDNSELSAALCSFCCESDKYFGYKKESSVQVYTNQHFAISEQIQTNDCSLSLIDAYCLSNGIATNDNSARDYLAINSANTKHAFEYLQKIRTKRSPNCANSKVIVFDIASLSQLIGMSDLRHLLEAMKDSKSCIPVLLSSNEDNLKQTIADLCKQISYSVVTIECDIVALPSVLLNTDLLISSMGNPLKLADNLGTPAIQIERRNPNGSDTDLPGNQFVNIRNSKELISDLLNVIEQFFEKETPSTSKNIQSYGVVKDDLGTNYIKKGSWNSSDIKNAIQRFFIAKCAKRSTSEIEEYFKNIPLRKLQAEIHQEKETMTSLTRLLLRTLKSLIKVNDKTGSVSEFVKNLDSLLATEEKTSSTGGLCTHKFRVHCNRVDPQVERGIFILKNDIQLALECFTQIEALVQNTPRRKGASIEEAN